LQGVRQCGSDAKVDDVMLLAACRLTLLYRRPIDTGLVARLVRIALLARHALRPARTGALAQGAAPRSIL